MILCKNIWNEKLKCAEFFPRNEIVSKAKNAKQRQQVRVKMLNDKGLFCSTKKIVDTIIQVLVICFAFIGIKSGG